MNLGIMAPGSNDNHLCLPTVITGRYEPEITKKVHWLQSLCQHTPGGNLTLSLPNGKTKAQRFCSWDRGEQICAPWLSWYFQLVKQDEFVLKNNQLPPKTIICRIYHRKKGQAINTSLCQDRTTDNSRTTCVLLTQYAKSGNFCTKLRPGPKADPK